MSLEKAERIYPSHISECIIRFGLRRNGAKNVIRIEGFDHFKTQALFSSNSCRLFLAIAKLLKYWWPGTESNRRRRPFRGRLPNRGVV